MARYWRRSLQRPCHNRSFNNRLIARSDVTIVIIDYNELYLTNLSFHRCYEVYSNVARACCVACVLCALCVSCACRVCVFYVLLLLSEEWEIGNNRVIAENGELESTEIRYSTVRTIQ